MLDAVALLQEEGFEVSGKFIVPLPHVEDGDVYGSKRLSDGWTSAAE